MCDSRLELRRRSEGGAGKLLVDSLSAARRTGDSIGESGRGIFSGFSLSSSGNGPSSGFAGETGREPGIGSSDFFEMFGRVTNGLANPPSTDDVSQLSNPSPRQEISSELFSRVAAKLPESLGVGPWASMSLVREVIGRTTCCTECLKVDDLFDKVGELGSKVDREKGDVFGDRDFNGIDKDRLIGLGVPCCSTIDSAGLSGDFSRLRRDRNMCKAVCAVIFTDQIAKPASIAPCEPADLSVVFVQVQPST